MAKQQLPKDCMLERYFSKYEFNTKFLLCCSDVEALSMNELINMADIECKQLWDGLKLSYTGKTSPVAGYIDLYLQLYYI